MSRLSDLVPHGALRSLSRRSDVAGLARLVPHLLLIAALGAAVVAARGGWMVWPAMLALGIAEMALFTPLHETTHRTPFRTPWLNRAVGWIAGFVLVLPPEWFRLFHLAHHRFTQDPAHDPEIAGAAPLTWRGYAWRLTGLPYWIGEWRTVAANAFGRADAPFIPADRRAAVVAEARVYLGLYAAVAAGSAALRTEWVFWLWVVPALLGQPFLRAFLMAEHGGLPRIDDGLRNTRTTLAGRAVAWLFWNANYHAEHHLAPGVPFHGLPRLHALMEPRLRAVSPSYVAAHAEIRATL